MKFPRVSLVLVLVAAGTLRAENSGPTDGTRERIRARLAEESHAAAPAAPLPDTVPAGTEAAAPASAPAPATAEPPGPAGTRAAAKSVEDGKKKEPVVPASVLPQLEVRKRRITELDEQLAKQDQAIAREKRNTKVSNTDKALNNSKIAKPLAIFGGESSEFRQHVANERVDLMEDEKDLIEAIAHAKTKQEKAELKRQLNILRAYRRELDKSLR